MTHPPASDLFFLRRPVGQRLCVHHLPSGAAARAALVYVHPFGEEMNKSRRMAALQARALAEAGCAVLQIDLLGCGDSSGLLSDADWETWLDDVLAACAWIAQRHPQATLWLWGLRAGGLLATEAAGRLQQPAHLLLWQPLVSGQSQLQQLLRVKAAGGLADGEPAAATMAALRADLAAGRTLDVAGYPLPAGLARAIEHATLVPPRPGCQVRWLELSTRPDAGLTPAAQKTIAAWRAGGADVQAQAVAGPAFWQTTEIEDAPALLHASVDAVRSAGGGVA